MGSAKAEENMNVIGHAADLLRNSAECFHTSAEIAMKVVAPVRLDPWVAVLGAEDNVVMETQMG